MIWVIIVLALLVAVLCVALYFQVKGSHDQAGEQEALLRDYQRLEGKNLLTMTKKI